MQRTRIMSWMFLRWRKTLIVCKDREGAEFGKKDSCLADVVVCEKCRNACVSCSVPDYELNLKHDARTALYDKGENFPCVPLVFLTLSMSREHSIVLHRWHPIAFEATMVFHITLVIASGLFVYLFTASLFADVLSKRVIWSFLWLYPCMRSRIENTRSSFQEWRRSYRKKYTLDCPSFYKTLYWIFRRKDMLKAR